MRVLMVAPATGVPVLGPSGASAHFRGMVRAFHGLGHDVQVLAARESDGRGVHGSLPLPVETVSAPGWPSWLSHWRERSETWHAARLARRARSWPAADIVYERWSLFSDVGRRLERPGTTWVLEVNAPLASERERYETLRDARYAARMQEKVLGAADLLVAVSPWIGRWLIDEVGIPASRVRVIPNGVEPYVGERAATRRELGVEDRFVVGFLGSMKPWHGVDVLSHVVSRIPDSVGLAVGAGPEPVGATVIHTGQVSEARTADLVAAMDVALAPYPPEAPPWFSPLKLLAYRAQGTPTVITDVADVTGLLGDGGTVVASGDLDAMVEACRDWKGRRPLPWLRSWTDVAGEVLSAVEARGDHVET